MLTNKNKKTKKNKKKKKLQLNMQSLLTQNNTRYFKISFSVIFNKDISQFQH